MQAPTGLDQRNAGHRVRSALNGGVPDQELLPGYRSWSWRCCSTSPHRPVEAPNRPVEAHPRSENGPSGPSTTCLVGLTRPPLAAQLTQEIETATAEDAPAVAPLGQPAGPYPAGPTAGSTVGARCGSGLAVPAGLVGWSEPGNQAKGGEAS
jgi:hypothetical protein